MTDIPARASPAAAHSGHKLRLLQGSGEFFPALVAAIDGATRLVRMETYIFDFTGESLQVALALDRAALRGVSVNVLVDGFGTAPLPPEWRERFAGSGVQWKEYAPIGTLGILWPGNWRRLHRKLCVIDGEVAFCGGINILDDLHDPNHGALAAPRFDFSVRVAGPLVADVEMEMVRVWRRVAQGQVRSRLARAIDAFRQPPQEAADAMPASRVRSLSKAGLLLRDNLRRRSHIERAYRRAIGHARDEIVIANAYFVPGGKMRRALILAARRGVKVQLLLQGRYEYFMQYYASRPVYGALLRAGVEIHEYAPSFLHAKVAVIDGRWATVGSSNLDPLSLLLAREANVVVEDTQFAAQLRSCLLDAIRQGGRALEPADYSNRSLRQRLMEQLAWALMRTALLVQGKKYL